MELPPPATQSILITAITKIRSGITKIRSGNFHHLTAAAAVVTQPPGD